MKRIHIRFNPSMDRDLINLMMNPLVDFNKLSKNALVNYIRGKVILVEVPPKISYEIEPERKYECYVSFRKNEMDVIEALQTIDSGQRNFFVKNVIRFSVKGALLNYTYDSGITKIPVDLPVEKRQIETSKPKEAPKRIENKPDIKSVVEKEPDEEVETVKTSSSDFDLFGELAALGAAPH